MDEGKILVVNLSKGLIGEDNAAILGSFLVTKIQLAAMSRSDIPNVEDRRPFYLLRRRVPELCHRFICRDFIRGAQIRTEPDRC